MNNEQQQHLDKLQSILERIRSFEIGVLDSLDDFREANKDLEQWLDKWHSIANKPEQAELDFKSCKTTKRLTRPTEETISKFLAMRNSGKRIDEIAEELGITHDQARTLNKKYGKPYCKRFSEDEKKRIKQAYVHGISYQDAAMLLNRLPGSISSEYNRLKKEQND